MTTLKCSHNAGFFSCCTLGLIAVMKYFNEHKCLPDIFDRSEQFAFFKKDPTNTLDNIVPEFFKEDPAYMPHTREMVVTNEPGEVSFGDYSKFRFDDIAPFLATYYMPSKKVGDTMHIYESKYNLDFNNTCGIFYRGNDKKRECDLTPYQEFIDKAREIEQENPGITFLVQPDETEFLQAFTKAFPGKCVWFEETPHMRKKDSAIFYELPPEKKTEHGIFFLAAVLTLGKCKHLITHSGNGGMWAVLYRGGFEGVHQFRNKHIY